MDLYVKQVTGGQPIRLTFDGAGNTTPNFSPDSSRIVFRIATGMAAGSTRFRHLAVRRDCWRGVERPPCIRRTVRKLRIGWERRLSTFGYRGAARSG